TGIEGEIADLATGYFGLLDGYVVQAEYLNSYEGPVIPYGSTPYFPGGGFAGVPGAGQSGAGPGGARSSPLGSPIPVLGSSVLSSATEPSQTLASGIGSERVGTDTRSDDFFAALARRENEGTDPRKRPEAGTGWEWLAFTSRQGNGLDDLAGG